MEEYKLWDRNVLNNEYYELYLENKRLKEALRKCDPMTEIIESQIVKGFTVKCCYSCETTNSTDHEIDCEYIKLINENK